MNRKTGGFESLDLSGKGTLLSRDDLLRRCHENIRRLQEVRRLKLSYLETAAHDIDADLSYARALRRECTLRQLIRRDQRLCKHHGVEPPAFPSLEVDLTGREVDLI
jgi:hypothetical protein